MTNDYKISRLARMTSIVTSLKSKRILTATDIAKKFDVSVRTIYRDMRTLESSGVPIITVDGKGYSLMDGYTMPPLMFTEAEINALVTAEHIINEIKDTSLSTHFQAALVKIKSVFRYELKEKSDLLYDRILVKKNNDSRNASNSLSALQLAITNNVLTKIIYQKPDDSLPTSRFIEPQALCYVNETWILIAWCRLRNAFRGFRIDRIQQLDFPNATFKSRDFDIKQYLSQHT